MSASPNIVLMNRQRGYQTFDITPSQWRTDVKVLDKVQSAGDRFSTLARFTIAPDTP